MYSFKYSYEIQIIYVQSYVFKQLLLLDNNHIGIWLQETSNNDPL